MSLNLDLISPEFNFNVASSSDRVVYVFDEYRLDKSRRMLYRGGLEINLPPKAIETLIALIEMRGEIVGKGDLMKSIWADTIVEESNLDHYLHVLRKALGETSDGQTFIETLRRRGYRFTPDVRVVEVPNRNGSPAEAPDLSPALFANQTSDANGSLLTPAVTTTGVPQPTVQSSRFAFVLGAVVVLAGLIGSAWIWYSQREDVPNRAASSNLRGEMSITPLTNGNTVYDATISPDGKYFVYYDPSENKQRFWIQQVGETVRVEITPPGEWTIGSPTFSPDSEFVYFVGREKEADRNALYRISTLGSAPVKILTGVDSPVSFSPDGRTMAFVRYDEKSAQSHLMTAAADGSDERTLLTRTGREGFSLGSAWSRDAKFIAYEAMNSNATSTLGNCSIETVDVETLETKALSAERWDTCYRMALTADGKGLVFVGTRSGEVYTTRRDQIYYISIADGRSQRISTDGSRYQANSLALTTDNALLAVPHKRFSQIWVMDATGDPSTAVRLTNGQLDGTAGIAPLPDGRVGYVSRMGDDLTIWVMNADGSDQRQIGLPTSSLEELRATPDGRFFIFSSPRDGFNHLYRIDTDGRDFRQMTTGETNEISSTISPDSSWIYYVSTVRDGGHWKNFLRKTAVDGSQTVTLTELEDGLIPDLSPDGKFIATLVGLRLTVLSSSDGTFVNSLAADKRVHVWAGARWTPDGRSLTYMVLGDLTSNVWVQSINGSAPRPLTNFPKGHILYEYAFSRDGKKLYVARGYQIQDAVVIKNF